MWLDLFDDYKMSQIELNYLKDQAHGMLVSMMKNWCEMWQQQGNDEMRKKETLIHRLWVYYVA